MARPAISSTSTSTKKTFVNMSQQKRSGFFFVVIILAIIGWHRTWLKYVGVFFFGGGGCGLCSLLSININILSVKTNTETTLWRSLFAALQWHCKTFWRDYSLEFVSIMVTFVSFCHSASDSSLNKPDTKYFKIILIFLTSKKYDTFYRTLVATLHWIITVYKALDG